MQINVCLTDERPSLSQSEMSKIATRGRLSVDMIIMDIFSFLTFNLCPVESVVLQHPSVCIIKLVCEMPL